MRLNWRGRRHFSSIITDVIWLTQRQFLDLSSCFTKYSGKAILGV